MFQSLSGFQVRCNMTQPLSSLKLTVFQSLSGFQVRCNKSLQVHIHRCKPLVSIPIGFSSSLQQRTRREKGRMSVKFQSLSGFQVRCNRIFIFPACCRGHVSIPIGFSSSLQPIDEMEAREALAKFQSLSGFQVRCNQNEDLVLVSREISFNPYRVFKFVATSRRR